MITSTMSWLEGAVLIGCLVGAVALVALLVEAQKDILALRREEIVNGSGRTARGERRTEAAKLIVIAFFVAQVAYACTRPEPRDAEGNFWGNVWKAGYIVAIGALVSDSVLRLRERRNYMAAHMDGDHEHDTGPLGHDPLAEEAERVFRAYSAADTENGTGEAHG